jgi:hypothetical protein
MVAPIELTSSSNIQKDKLRKFKVPEYSSNVKEASYLPQGEQDSLGYS